MSAAQLDVNCVAGLARLAPTPGDGKTPASHPGNVPGRIEKLKEFDVCFSGP